MDLREKMLTMLDTTSVKEQFGMSAELLISVSFAAMNNANVYLWAEKDLHIYVRLFKSWDLNVHKVVCVFPKEFKKVDDVEIVAPNALIDDETPNKIFFVDVSAYRIENANVFWNEIMKQLSPLAVHFISPVDRTAITFNYEPFDVESLPYYQSHKKELMELFDLLADETSKRALYHYVESFIKNCVYKGEHISTRWKYFFGGEYERLYKHLDGECWINCGASIGDTVFQYLSFDFKPKKIYAFEGDEATFKILLNNLSRLPPDKRELVEPINEMIGETTDFEKILAGNKCTLLNADIEGAEPSLLCAMKNVIQADRPVMAICVYHYKEDLLTIPQFIQSICPDYVYYLRKYTSGYGHMKHVGEMVFYAVPIERSILHAPPHCTLILIRDKKFLDDIIAALSRFIFLWRKVYGSKIY